MASRQFRETTISAALSHAINQVPDDGLKLKVDVLVAKAARAINAARSLDFAGYEDRELEEHSLQLWNEAAPLFKSVFTEMSSLVDAALELFPKPATPVEDDLGKDFDRAFDLLAEGEAHPVTGEISKPRSSEEVVNELVHSYAWVLKQALQAESRKLREPGLMQQQWNLLGELEAFRDKVVGTMHAMVAAVLGVFDEVEVETLFPDANEWVEMGVALRRHVADLAREVEGQVARLRAPDLAGEDELRQILAHDEELTALILKLPSIASLRVADRHEMAEFHRSAARLRAGAITEAQARQLLDGYGTFLASIHAVELKERLMQHDVEVAGEALEALQRAEAALATDAARTGMMLLVHAGRRVARLYGISTDLDAASRGLRDLHGREVNVSEVLRLITQMKSALQPVAEAP